jgi:OOP family OmpA-OmpF porin
MSRKIWGPKEGLTKARAEAEGQARNAEMARAELALLMKELSELQGQLTDRWIVLTIGDVLFATDKSDLNASAQISMYKLAVFLQNKQNRSLLVEGHTDSVGSNEYNQGLSEQRAASVTQVEGEKRKTSFSEAAASIHDRLLE